MKRGTDLTLKFQKLRHRLGWPTYQVKGLLQAIWDFTAENALMGDIGKFSDADICFGIGFEDPTPAQGDGHAGPPVHREAEEGGHGDPPLQRRGEEGRTHRSARTQGGRTECFTTEELIQILIEERWIDRNERHRLVIHDWIDHCEDWIKKKVVRRLEAMGYSKEQDLHEFYKRVFCGVTAANGTDTQVRPYGRGEETESGRARGPAPTNNGEGENGGERQTSADIGGERQTLETKTEDGNTTAANGGQCLTMAANGGLPEPSLAKPEPEPGPGLATSAAADSRAAPPPPEESVIYHDFVERLTQWNLKNGRPVPASTQEDTQSTQVTLSAIHRLEPMGDPYATFKAVTDWIFAEDEYTAMRVRGMAWLAANIKWIYDRYMKAMVEKENKKKVVPIEKQTFGNLKEGAGVNRSNVHSNPKQSARHAARV